MASSTSTIIFSSSLPSGFRFRPLISGCRAFLHLGHGGVTKRAARSLAIRSQSLDLSGSFFDGGDEEGEGPPLGPTAAASIAALEDKEEPQCPPGLRQYETMAVLRPDMTEDERLSFTQRYEELLITGGGMYVEVFNRGVIPLAYSIKKKNKAGESNTYLDGIYLLFTYFTKPESIIALETRLKKDDDVIRSSSFKIRKRRY
ncbi:30S ribosomal protein S6 alpha, chloroplastic [Phalaenopsis equestris]|uniref:30S ribosomal protein S6 alpha, chloroplastic n=1 Tax=Phalaenopsis equestris TaxID=78828 RepID=UPI0009E347DE|nr:30S ribosomal protein S6 alpha, chloroplastic [Phalaenopsis equestris]